MGTVLYTVMNGQVLSESRDGVKRDYLSDPLGNTTALVDSAGTKTDTFSYFPFGNVASRTGTTATPFQWVGGYGYFQDSGSRTYVRARTMYTNTGRWNMQDPIGFEGGDYNLYRYVENKILTITDPSGKFPLSSAMVVAMILEEFGSCLLCMHRIKGPVMDEAKRWGKKYGIDYKDDNYTNAFQHCYLSCQAVKQCGFDCAKGATDIHETPGFFPLYDRYGAFDVPTTPKNEKVQERRHCMDLYNNVRGFNCADANDCSRCCSINALSGSLAVIDPIGRPQAWAPPKVNCSNPQAVIRPPITLN